MPNKLTFTNHSKLKEILSQIIWKLHFVQLIQHLIPIAITMISKTEYFSVTYVEQEQLLHSKQ